MGSIFLAAVLWFHFEGIWNGMSIYSTVPSLLRHRIDDRQFSTSDLILVYNNSFRVCVNYLNLWNILQLCILSTECIYGFCKIFRVKSNYLLKQHQPIDLVTETRRVFYAAGTEFYKFYIDDLRPNVALPRLI
jgi:hypothetical protein